MTRNKWTSDKVGIIKGLTIIVTGGNSGIGYELVKVLSEKGARVIMASRSLIKAERAKNKIIKKNPEANVHIMELDLADLSSIKKFAIQFQKEYARLDVLINNAGIMNIPYSLTKDSFEMQMGINHLGSFALTGLLIDILKKSPGSRVVNTASIAHKKAVMDFDNLLYNKGQDYNGMAAYRRSKLANLYFTFELQRYFQSRNINCIALAGHPGVTESNIARHMFGPILFKILKPLIQVVLQKASVGALPTLRAAIDPDVKGGDYYGPDGKSEWRGYPVLVEATDYAKNEEIAKKLWKISEKLTGVKFGDR